MRIAVISDIHGNCYALDAVLADLREQGQGQGQAQKQEQEQVDQMVCLGDAIQGGAQPVETVQRLRELGCPVVMGNADAWLLDEGGSTAEPTSVQQREVRAWSLAELSPADLAFIGDFQPTVEIALEAAPRDEPPFGQRLLCFHGSPVSYDDILLPTTPNEEWLRLLGPFAPAIMTGGHTHTQQVRRIGDGLFFNPGSIGVAYNILEPRGPEHTEAWAEYAMLSVEPGRLSLDFRRVAYEVERLIDIIQASGRPHADTMIAAYRRSDS
jgi:predicted phosphodiesterase